jgi:hypothetical protein
MGRMIVGANTTARLSGVIYGHISAVRRRYKDVDITYKIIAGVLYDTREMED